MLRGSGAKGLRRLCSAAAGRIVPMGNGDKGKRRKAHLGKKVKEEKREKRNKGKKGKRANGERRKKGKRIDAIRC